MRPTHLLALIVLTLSFGACTEHPIPAFDEPLPISVPAGDNAHGPRLAQGLDDTAILSWMERGDGNSTLRFSVYDEGSWTSATSVIADGDMFVNWADLPAVTPIRGGSLLAHWLSYTADAPPYAYSIRTARSDDQGATWSEPSSPHTDGTPTEHGFVSVYNADAGTGLIWLDGRKMGGDATGNPVDTGMTLRGATIAPDGSLLDEVQLDNLTCDCCQTDVAMTEKGPVAVYRDRTSEEIRDIYVARNLNGQWQPGVPISEDNWNIAGCPVNGPSIDSDGKLIVVAWFSAPNNKPIVQTAISTNSGKSFSTPIVIAEEGALGHVGISLIGNHSYVVSWMESDKKGTYAINVRGITVNGQMGPVQTVGRTGVARNVPQMIRVKDNLVLAWTDEIGESRKIVSVEVPVLGFYD